ncbi:hypothetical protein BDV32DRAFT_131291 [Aspergillus pseudonomiae]|nr:hypothetical protein BDV32DRAFT_131291 [Aspergillus pseudonomiae]
MDLTSHFAFRCYLPSRVFFHNRDPPSLAVGPAVMGVHFISCILLAVPSRSFDFCFGSFISFRRHIEISLDV